MIEATPTTATTEYDVRPGPHLEADGRLWAGALVEGLAQTAAVLGAQAGRGGAADLSARFVGARGVRFARRPQGGETVRYSVEVIKALGPLVLVSGEARCGEEVVAAGNLKLYLAEP